MLYRIRYDFLQVQETITGHKFKKGIHVEVVDRMCVSAMRVATIEEVIGGRLRLHYDDAKVLYIILPTY